MSTRRFFTNLAIAVLVIIVVVLAALLGFEYMNDSNNDNPGVNTTNVPTMESVISSTEPIIPNVTVTNTPWIPIVVTNTPMATKTPEVWYITTVTPNNNPTVLPTDVIITPFPTITVAPTITPMPTITPTPTPIVTVVPTATPVVTNPPTQVPTPTQQVTEAPSKYSKEALEIARKELYKLTGGVNEILPDYIFNRKYDLYNYITIDKINPYELFEILKDIFINTMAHSFDFNFDYGHGIQGLEMILNSAYCPTCGRLESTYKRENDANMISLLESIKYDDIANANMIMLNFLYNNSYVSNDNINERLVICCSCNN